MKNMSKAYQKCYKDETEIMQFGYTHIDWKISGTYPNIFCFFLLKEEESRMFYSG